MSIRCLAGKAHAEHEYNNSGNPVNPDQETSSKRHSNYFGKGYRTSMARVKVTSSDINAKLAKGECANYRSNGCQGRQPCTVVNGEACVYFNTYVKPLLDYPDYLAKYGREAKISVALNPKSKVVRKRRQANEPALAVNPAPAAPLPSAQVKSKPAAKPAGLVPTAPPKTRQIPATAAALPKHLPAPRLGKRSLAAPRRPARDETDACHRRSSHIPGSKAGNHTAEGETTEPASYPHPDAAAAHAHRRGTCAGKTPPATR